MKKLITLAFLTSLASVSYGQAGYQPPIPSDMVNPDYQALAEYQRRGHEGWVFIGADINSDGQPSATRVLYSSGTEAFENEALKAVSKSTFEPARLDGSPTEGFIYGLFAFASPDIVGVSRPFARRHRTFEEAFSENDIEAAKTAIEEMKSLDGLNRADLSYLAFNEYRLALLLEEDANTRAEYLYQALMYETSMTEEQSTGMLSVLPDDMKAYLRLSLLAVEVERKFYSEALDLYSILQREGTDVSNYQNTIDQIERIRVDNSAYSIFDNIEHHGASAISLFKRSFYIDNLGNSLDDLHIACENMFQAITFVEEANYAIPESWGKCRLEIFGEPQAEFELIQYSE